MSASTVHELAEINIVRNNGHSTNAAQLFEAALLLLLDSRHDVEHTDPPTPRHAALHAEKDPAHADLHSLHALANAQPCRSGSQSLPTQHEQWQVTALPRRAEKPCCLSQRISSRGRLGYRIAAWARVSACTIQGKAKCYSIDRMAPIAPSAWL